MAEQVGFDKSELRAVFKALKNMDEEANDEAKRQAGALAEFVHSSVVDSAAMRQHGRAVAVRIATGARVKKSSKIGEITYGFAAQKFSGGGTTKQLWGGAEFGSNRYKQFPVWSGKFGRGSRGWFIYPTLRAIQPEIIARWTQSFDKILKEWA